MNKKRIVTILIVIATVILAGVAVFTAIRLYQLRNQPVAPTAPTSEPAAAAPVTEACTVLSFTVSADEPTASPTESPTASPTESPTASPSGSPVGSPTAAPTGSPTTAPALPEAGINSPTIISLGVGILLIIGSLLLVF